MNYEHLHNEINVYLKNKNGDKSEIQKAALDFISHENPLNEKIQIGVLLGYLGDPRVGNPSTDSYWVRVEVSFLDLLVGKFPVTTQEWRQFYESENYHNDDLWTEEGVLWRNADRPSWGTLASAEESKDFIHPNQPVVGVCFHEALAFATYHNARLLYSDERLDIIRGQERRVYPWGKDFGRGNANTKEEVLQRPSPVGIFTNDKTPNGIYDLVGNVAEWMGDQDEGQHSIHPGSWHNDMMSAWPKASKSISPNTRLNYLGFRLTKDLPEDL